MVRREEELGEAAERQQDRRVALDALVNMAEDGHHLVADRRLRGREEAEDVGQRNLEQLGQLGVLAQADAELRRLELLQELRHGGGWSGAGAFRVLRVSPKLWVVAAGTDVQGELKALETRVAKTTRLRRARRLLTDDGFCVDQDERERGDRGLRRARHVVVAPRTCASDRGGGREQ